MKLGKSFSSGGVASIPFLHHISTRLGGIIIIHVNYEICSRFQGRLLIIFFVDSLLYLGSGVVEGGTGVVGEMSFQFAREVTL